MIAADVLARIDDGLVVTTADRAVSDVLDRACQQAAFVPPMFCGHGVDLNRGDCNGCDLDWDAHCRRAEDQ